VTDGAPTRIFLHIGTMKSGTSYVQGMLWRSRNDLRADGVLYPGEAAWAEQVEAVRDAIGVGGPDRRPVQVGAWNDMARQMLAWPGHSVIMSMELFSFAGARKVAEIVESLSAAEVHAIITARDLARVIPSAWQESTQNRQTWTWPHYVSSLTGIGEDEPVAYRRFWKQHDLAVMATSWSAAVGAARVHLITVPPSGAPRDELWRRFCSVVGLDANRYVVPDSVRGNPAVGAASAEFLRRLNERLGDLDPATYERLVKRFLGKRTLAHREDEPRLALPARYQQWASDRAATMVDQLRSSGIDVVGDLDDLLPTVDPNASDVDQVTDHEVVDAALHAAHALVLELAAADPDSVGGRRRRRQNKE
jgi:hypothetical protein